MALSGVKCCSCGVNLLDDNKDNCTNCGYSVNVSDRVVFMASIYHLKEKLQAIGSELKAIRAEAKESGILHRTPVTWFGRTFYF
ncbi:hypothetical protein GW933_04255 [Candidatus Falkowbacteria bacterium]|uniref:Uncharacterized protein n=1 Tax=Candidatus Buchananbacteria bacterium CG10_big_fil_rev_8_21_14_0_10_33_19 TaxID=1974525 RepID=A0A2H0W544_9BACT|nr:hypothetical protein [Candidatus Falkowbacteria bacterium]PIS06455.1 MAG: hypothetical protein COT80_00740 [Candidatus Buchananbacteria bacterium CG10_big_fil_rev_8_21_14_0_10_33_19]